MKIAVQRIFEELSEGVEFPEFPAQKNHEKKKYTAAFNKGGNKRGGGSLFASASNVYGSNNLEAAMSDDPILDAFSTSMAKVYGLSLRYDPSKIIHCLRKFGVTFKSVKEMLTSDGSEWSLMENDMLAVNSLLSARRIPRIQWKALVQRETVFPWVPVDKCEVPEGITPRR